MFEQHYLVFLYYLVSDSPSACQTKPLLPSSPGSSHLEGCLTHLSCEKTLTLCPHLYAELSPSSKFHYPIDVTKLLLELREQVEFCAESGVSLYELLSTSCTLECVHCLHCFRLSFG